jgi:hypothetical protein
MTNLWKTADESNGGGDTDTNTEGNPWDWGVLKTPDGEIIPPGACEGYHGKDNQRDMV